MATNLRNFLFLSGSMSSIGIVTTVFLNMKVEVMMFDVAYSTDSSEVKVQARGPEGRRFESRTSDRTLHESSPGRRKGSPSA